MSNAQILSDFFGALIDRHHRPQTAVYSVGCVSLGVGNDFEPMANWTDTALTRSAGSATAHVSCVYQAADLSPISRWRDADFGQRIDSLLQAGLRGFFNDETGVLEVFDPRTNQGLRMLPSPAAIPPWEATAPLANFAAWSNAVCGSVMLHAAAVGTDRCAVLFCGPGGSGKSLLTLACAMGGLRTVGDDYVFVQHSEDQGFTALPYSRLAKQSRRGLGLLGASGAQLLTGDVNWQDKRCFTLAAAAPESYVASLPVKAVVSLRLGAAPEVAEIPPRAAFLDIVQSTDRQLAAMADTLFPAVGPMTRALPTYRLMLGRDVWANVSAVRSLLQRIEHT